jgi:mRNA-degrading endonuclease RelE of RelBE toxin-antitoxin system
VSEALTLLGADPRAAGKPLVGRLRGLWSARIGNYRILYTIQASSGAERATVRAIRHRAVVYQRRPN